MQRSRQRKGPSPTRRTRRGGPGCWQGAELAGVERQAADVELRVGPAGRRRAYSATSRCRSTLAAVSIAAPRPGDRTPPSTGTARAQVRAVRQRHGRRRVAGPTRRGRRLQPNRVTAPPGGTPLHPGRRRLIPTEPGPTRARRRPQPAESQPNPGRPPPTRRSRGLQPTESPPHRGRRRPQPRGGRRAAGGPVRADRTDPRSGLQRRRSRRSGTSRPRTGRPPSLPPEDLLSGYQDSRVTDMSIDRYRSWLGFRFAARGLVIMFYRCVDIYNRRADTDQTP